MATSGSPASSNGKGSSSSPAGTSRPSSRAAAKRPSTGPPWPTRRRAARAAARVPAHTGTAISSPPTRSRCASASRPWTWCREGSSSRCPRGASYNREVRRLAVVLSVALFLGCQQSPAPGPAPVGSLTVRLKAEGDALAGRGGYEGAALKYQQAANQEPEDVSIRFALGSALSHLNPPHKTLQQFRFVVARGKPDSPDVQ